MAIQQQTQLFNPRAEIVTPARFAVPELVLLLQWLITQVPKPIPQIVTFVELPVPSYIGQTMWITDSNTATWGATIAGSGALAVLGVWTGVTWTVMGKKA